ncbi:MAG: spore coat associated protein CotJA [Firmicutes bacterium]|nr:spore coat associated protein CotJA [Bacillota bacterium]
MDRGNRYRGYGNKTMQTRTANVQNGNCICTDQPVSLAMAYVKNQEFKDLFIPEEGLSKGTMFSELYLPYCIGGKR